MNNYYWQKQKEESDAKKATMGCILFIIGYIIGFFALDAAISIVIGKHIQPWLTLIAAFFLWRFCVPALILVWILQAAGVHFPLH
jgi:hypothetical protein